MPAKCLPRPVCDVPVKLALTQKCVADIAQSLAAGPIFHSAAIPTADDDVFKPRLDFVLLICVAAAWPSQAHAYVDPGSGSAIVTAVLGVVAAISYTLRKQFYRIKNLFSRDDKNQ